MIRKGVKEKFKRAGFKAKWRKRGQNATLVTRKQEKGKTKKEEKLCKVFYTEMKPQFLAINGEKSYNQKKPIKDFRIQKDKTFMNIRSFKKQNK